MAAGKKIAAMLLAGLLAVFLTACSGETAENEEQEITVNEPQGETEEVPAEETEVLEQEAPEEEASEQETPEEEGSAENGTNILVAYFSYAENAELPEDVDASSSASIQAWNGKLTGNTGVIASMIAEAAGADLFSIQTVETYPDSYDAVIDQGQEERSAGARPELVSNIENLDDYEVIFLGYPKMEQGFTRV